MKEHSLTGMKGDDGKYFPETFDARIWAEEFDAVLLKNQAIAYDKETMTGWFANAIMRGYDTARARHS